MNSDFTIALHVMGFLASRQGLPVTSVALASSYGTSPVVVRRVLMRLQSAQLIEARRGPGGGSVLAREPAGINLRQVYEAVTDNPQFLKRHPGNAGTIAGILAEFVNDVCGEAERALLETLEAVTVEGMDAQVRPRILAEFCKRE